MSTSRIVARSTPQLVASTSRSGLATFRAERSSPVLRSGRDIPPVFGAKPLRPAQRRHTPLNPISRKLAAVAIEAAKQPQVAVETPQEVKAERGTVEPGPRTERAAVERDVKAKRQSLQQVKKTRSLVYWPEDSYIDAYVNQLLAPLALPAELAIRACTHKSVSQARKTNYNEKLSFIGA